jgi:GH24 family phage-related lysozyme (muramidase)
MYLDDAVKNTEQFEGRVNHMYLDSKGNVTVAVGLMIPTTAAALNLPFKRRGLGQDFPASQLEILDDYNRVKAASVGHVATYYHNAESVILEDAEIDSQLLSWLKGLDQELAAHFPKYNDWPAPAKLAYLDMAYNLGTGRLFREYPRMNAAAAIEAFMQCAAECGRESGDPAFDRRNAWTRQMFRAAWTMRNTVRPDAAAIPLG